MYLQDVYLLLKKPQNNQTTWRSCFERWNGARAILQYVNSCCLQDLMVLSLHVLGEKPRMSWETSEGCTLSLAVKALKISMSNVYYYRNY